jgi:phage N-6-adenine-methyltransferase
MVPQSTLAKQDWRTPRWFYHAAERRHGAFALDLAASADNCLSPLGYCLDLGVDAFTRNWTQDLRWHGNGRRAAWCNPPYQDRERACGKDCAKKTCVKRGHHTAVDIPGVRDWLDHHVTALAADAREYPDAPLTLVFLLRIAGMSTNWFADFAPFADVEIITPRLNFVDPANPGKEAAPTGSMLMIFTPATIATAQENIVRTRIWHVREGDGQ